MRALIMSECPRGIMVHTLLLEERFGYKDKRPGSLRIITTFLLSLWIFFPPEIVSVFHSSSIYQAFTMLGTGVANTRYNPYPPGGCARQSPWGSQYTSAVPSPHKKK